MKKCMSAVLLGSILALSVAVASADVGVNLKAGTLGAGVELSKSLSDKFSLGLGFNSYNFNHSATASDVDYDFKFKLQSVALLGNYHPFRGVFRLTAGLLDDNNKLSLTGKPNGSGQYNINGVSYSASQVGSLTGDLTFRKAAPYIGLGWGNRPNSRFGLTADIGALYQGSPKLSLSATGALSNPALAANLDQERAKAESDLGKYKWWPVLSLGLYFRF